LSFHMRGDGAAAMKAREAAALTASSRWAYRSALARAESRGMHRRRDRPDPDPAFACLFEARGLDRVEIRQQDIPWRAAA
jgi:succinate dehydrogenase/fumarate reductase flavoprotein subunit